MTSPTTISAEAIIGIYALFVSFISVLFTILSFWVQRIHNRKSVKPIGMITVGDYEDDIFIRIDNSGIGPMIIKKLEVKNSDRTATSVIDILPDDLCKKVTWATFAKKVEGKALLAGDELKLIEYQVDYDNPKIDQRFVEQFKEDLRGSLKNIHIYLEYTDVYEKETFKVDRSMDWFGRHFKK
jgi:hypothetical protein